MKKPEVMKYKGKYEARMELQGCGFELVITYNREDDDFSVSLFDQWGEERARDDFFNVEMFLREYFNRVIERDIEKGRVIDEDESED